MADVESPCVVKQVRVGNRAAVWSGAAKQTAGGLKKDDLFMEGSCVKSKRASESGKKTKNLEHKSVSKLVDKFETILIEPPVKPIKSLKSKK